MKKFNTLLTTSLAIVTVIAFQNCGEGFESISNSEEDFLSSLLNKNEILSGDMILETDAIAVKGGEPSNGGQQAATGITIYNSKYWDNGIIPVQFELTHRDRNYREKLFFQACAEWSQHANVKCVQRTTESNYLLVRDTVKACNTHVGAGKYGGERVFTFGLDWCWSKKSLLHEMGHVLGLMHEHQRPDRDNYVTVNHKYIKPGFEHAYKKFHTADIKSSYDFESVMHYGAYAYSIHSSLPVMLPNSAYQNKLGIMGEYDKLSTLDKQIANKIYSSAAQPTPIPTPTPTPIPTPTPTPIPTPTPTPVSCGAVNMSFGQGCTYRSDTKKTVGTYSIPNVTAGYTGTLKAECQSNGLYKFSNWTCTSTKPEPTPTLTPTPTPTPTPAPIPVYDGGGGIRSPGYQFNFQ